MNFRIHQGILFNNVDQYVEVRYEYQRIDDLKHHSNDSDHERTHFKREEKRNDQIRQDTYLSQIADSAKTKFGTNPNCAHVALTLDRNTWYISRIINDKKVTIKNTFGDRQFAGYPNSLPAIIRFQEVSKEDVNYINESQNSIFICF